MFKLFKYLKKSVAPLLAIVLLLVIQAVCDLSLPDYTSKIVNVGIQQGGVENAVPNIIRKSELDKLMIFMDEDGKKEVIDNYILLDKSSLSAEDYKKYKKDYPQLENESLYKLNTKNKETIDKLNNIFGKPMILVSGFDSDSEQAIKLKDQLLKNLPPQANTGSDVDVFNILSLMPSEQIDYMKDKLDEQFKDFPDSMVTQSAVSYVKAEYENIGINTEKNQNIYILISGAKMLGIALISMMTTVAVGFLGARVAANLGKNLRSGVFRKVMNFSNEELTKFSTASLITRSTNDIQQIQMLMVMMLRTVIYAPILGIGGVIKVMSTNTSMAWIIGVAVAAISCVVLFLFAVVMPKFKLLQKLVDRLNLVTREILTGIPVIRAFSTVSHEEERFDNANKDLIKTNLFVNRIMSCMMPMMMLIMNLITVLIVYKGAYSIDSGAMQVGDMMAFMQYTMQIIMSFLMISMVSIMLPRASVSASRIDEVLTADLSIKDPEESQDFDTNKKGLIEFKNVSFRYPYAEEDTISNVSFTAKPGQTTAFIGSTGSGKSTLVNLIPRLFDVSEGQILLDGVDIRNVSQHKLREKIGYVPQKGILFSGTIESNIKYGKNNASEEEMIKAARIAQATEFINSKPDGYSTEISQGGTNVSGGQKQRLSIARAIAKNPDVYIFDDSFSALDYKTDTTLRRALKSEISDSTVIIVAQRISTILHAEQIIVLDEGKVVGIGTHQELLKNCEVYNQIALSQLSKEELANG